MCAVVTDILRIEEICNMCIYNFVKCFERTVNSFIKECATGDMFEGLGKVFLEEVAFHLRFAG